LIYGPTYFEMNRTDGIVFFQVTRNAGRTIQQKKSLDVKIGVLLSEEVLLNLERVREDWSFGKGIASYPT
jgi:4-oxalocrotonate tautomerase